MPKLNIGVEASSYQKTLNNFITNTPSWNFSSISIPSFTVDGSGNVYFLDVNATVMKYNSSFVLQWATRITPSPGFINANGLTVDASGNVYIAGSTGALQVVVKLTSAGAKAWTAVTTYSTAQSDSAYASAVDASGNVYVVGSNIFNTTYQATLAKYNSAGVHQWTRQVQPVNASSGAEFLNVAIDSAGSIICSGYQISGATFDYNLIVVKYDSAGTRTWTSTSSASGFDFTPRRVTLVTDSSNNIYSVFQSTISNIYRNVLVIKLDSTGARQYIKRISDASIDQFESIRPNGLAIDSSLNLYFSGRSSTRGYLAKIDSTGAITKQYHSVNSDAIGGNFGTNRLVTTNVLVYTGNRISRLSTNLTELGPHYPTNTAEYFTGTNILSGVDETGVTTSTATAWTYTNGTPTSVVDPALWTYTSYVGPTTPSYIWKF